MKKDFWDRLGTFLGLLSLILAIVAGIAGAYLLGSFFGMGMPGYALGFLLGIALVYGWSFFGIGFD